MLLLSAALAVTPALASRSHRTATAGHAKSSKKKHSASHVIQGQRGIDSGRATQIQTALIHQKYMSGSPTGQWDEQTQAAMQKFQADHGWQTKLTPDSRALIKLGLGPDHEAGAIPTQTAAAESVSAANAGSMNANSASVKQAPGAPAASLPSVSTANTLEDAHSIQN